MYFYLSIILLALGLLLILSPDSILLKESPTQQTIHENSKILGAVSIGLAYYTYTLSTSNSSATTPLLPTYEEVTSEQ